MEFYKSRNSDRKKSSNFARNEKPLRSFRNSRDDRKGESTTVTCADCGTECQIPFVPRTNRPVYCSDCFRQNKPQDSGNDTYSRDDRSSRSSYGKPSSKNDFRSKRSKNDKFLKNKRVSILMAQINSMHL